MLGATIGAIGRYPVKSMRGETLTEVDVTPGGLPGDRGWALVDRETGRVASAKLPRLWACLLECRANIIAGETRITLPDGQVVVAGEPAADAALTQLTGRAITLKSTAPEGIQLERYWPDIDGMALRDTETTGTIAAAAPPGTFFDHGVLHLLTTATLRYLAELAPASQFDARRFRPNLLIDVPDNAPGFIENEWVGTTLTLGDVVRLRITDPTPRCVVTTLPQAELSRDLEILRAIALHNRPPIPALDGATLPCLGVYAKVERVGVVRAGDHITHRSQ